MTRREFYLSERGRQCFVEIVDFGALIEEVRFAVDRNAGDEHPFQVSEADRRGSWLTEAPRSAE
jgi:hypothetical protein